MAPNQINCAVTEGACKALVDLYDALIVQQAVGVRRVLKEDGELGFTFNQGVLVAALVCNVDQCANHAGGSALLVEVQGGGRLQPALALVDGDAIGQTVARLAPPTDGNEGAANGLPVLGNDMLQEVARAAVPVVALEAVQLCTAGRAVQGVGRYLPIPDAHLPGLQRHFQAAAAVFQGLLAGVAA